MSNGEVMSVCRSNLSVDQIVHLHIMLFSLWVGVYLMSVFRSACVCRSAHVAFVCRSDFTVDRLCACGSVYVILSVSWCVSYVCL